MTAMNTLAAIGPDLSEMPRFDDGMVNIRELIRTMAEALVNEIMDAQAEDACADGNQRNGYRDRALVTSVGVINLRIPKRYCPDSCANSSRRLPAVGMVTRPAATRPDTASIPTRCRPRT